MFRFSLPVLLVIFLLAAVVVWLAGIQLTAQTDVLDKRWRLGSALGGLILLAVATNLPEIAIVASAAVSGTFELAVGNILGGIAIQTVVLVVLDLVGIRGGPPLSYRAASLVMVLEAALVVAVLALVVASTQLPANLIAFRMTPGPVLITVLWVVGLVLLKRAGRSLPWPESGQAPGNQEHPRGYRRRPPVTGREAGGIRTRRSVTIFAVAAVVTLIGGVILERSGAALADRLDMSGVVFGATALAAATALPEVSTGLASVRRGDYQLAFSDILGGNAFLPVLFLEATLLSGQAVLPAAQNSDVYLAALGILVTLVYLAGLLFRPRRRIAGMGVDSLIVLILYGIGLIGLLATAPAA